MQETIGSIWELSFVGKGKRICVGVLIIGLLENSEMVYLTNMETKTALVYR